MNDDKQTEDELLKELQKAMIDQALFGISAVKLDDNGTIKHVPLEEIPE